jgi:hypothetical protein
MRHAIRVASPGLTAPDRCSTWFEARLDGRKVAAFHRSRGTIRICRTLARESSDGSKRLAADHLPGHFAAAE